ncbi:to mitochondrial phosphate carrier protein Mir1 [Geosmithia morbida]|uniref:To mitochondrial phosphate carrier protein Mir1 n=1 Tax=Geosmithia morbida TaxID=1094350 RepID=A0A9P4YUV4_9HYPO|nr:to mitochondrial phosphate carrier protein Mir1 [Geosmithia morbida]KAF4122126.1 to mitochondrial phosphate carrier protein Mir1 [Geosmithia morbida]
MIVTRAISLTNFMVASSALGFQVFVLYPWHKELDAGFEELKREHLKVLDAVGHSLANEERKAFSDKFNELKASNSRSIYMAAEASSKSVKTAAASASATETSAAPSKIVSTTRGLDASTYARYALAGAFCCSFTHAILTPVDV